MPVILLFKLRTYDEPQIAGRTVYYIILNNAIVYSHSGFCIEPTVGKYFISASIWQGGESWNTVVFYIGLQGHLRSVAGRSFM